MKRTKSVIKKILRYAGQFLSIRRNRLSFAISSQGKSCFGGYPDCNIVYDQEVYYHCCSVAHDSEVNPKNFQITRYNIQSRRAEYIATTRACNFQLGSRLNITSDGQLLFNDIVGKDIVMRQYDLRNHQAPSLVSTLDGGYQINIGANVIVQSSFARIHKFRPGYGYNGVDDLDNAVVIRRRVDQSDIWSSETIHEVASSMGYANNFLACPCDETFSWVDVVEGEENKDRYGILQYYNGHDVVSVMQGHISHMFYHNYDLYFLTRITGHYVLKKYDHINNHLSTVGPWGKHDSHFCIANDIVYSDSYPNHFGVSFIHKSNINSITQKKLVHNMWTPTKFTGHVRCDQHPKNSESYILFDFVKDGQRQIGAIEK